MADFRLLVDGDGWEADEEQAEDDLQDTVAAEEVQLVVLGTPEGEGAGEAVWGPSGEGPELEGVTIPLESPEDL